MSQSLRVVKRFRIRELLALASPRPKNSRIPPAATSASNLRTSEDSSPTSRSATGGTTPPNNIININNNNNTLNPFIPHKNLESGRWAPPKYSLRRQADLIKHARKSGTLHLLPPGPKMTLAQQQLAATTTSSVLGKDRVEDNVVVGVTSGLVSLRQGQEVPERQEEATEAAVEKEAQGGEEEVLALAPEQNLLDAQAEADWTMPVEWMGTVRERNVAGADIGNRLYAGKKRMFKGHKWERMRERRVDRTKMLVRDMDKRIERFKGYRAKGKPLPLARRNNVLKKTQKLPF